MSDLVETLITMRDIGNLSSPQRAALADACNEIDRLRKIIDGLVLVCGRTGDAFYDFEECAEAYQKDTGRMAPGKDRPAAMGEDDYSPENARIHYKAWIQTKIQAGRDVLKN